MNRGFTYIEILVSLAIIGMILAVVGSSVSSSRQKARDAEKKTELLQVSLTLNLFYQKNGRMPLNYNPGIGACEGNSSYTQSMQELVTGGFLKEIPKSPGGYGYCYYDYGTGATGALLATQFEQIPPSTTGVPDSCRPFAANTNWCDTSSNTWYCVCTPY